MDELPRVGFMNKAFIEFLPRVDGDGSGFVVNMAELTSWQFVLLKGSAKLKSKDKVVLRLVRYGGAPVDLRIFSVKRTKGAALLERALGVLNHIVCVLANDPRLKIENFSKFKELFESYNHASLKDINFTWEG